ncbi:MAG: hypothetical protein OXI18_11560 [bacterium]|nr:hypothetical protein [bacterium]
MAAVLLIGLGVILEAVGYEPAEPRRVITYKPTPAPTPALTAANSPMVAALAENERLYREQASKPTPAPTPKPTRTPRPIPTLGGQSDYERTRPECPLEGFTNCMFQTLVDFRDDCSERGGVHYDSREHDLSTREILATWEFNASRIEVCLLPQTEAEYASQNVPRCGSADWMEAYNAAQNKLMDVFDYLERNDFDGANALTRQAQAELVELQRACE